MCGEEGALAETQKAAEVETRTEPLLFGPSHVHRSEMLFRHSRPLHRHPAQSERGGLCSCLALTHLLGKLDCTPLL